MDDPDAEQPGDCPSPELIRHEADSGTGNVYTEANGVPRDPRKHSEKLDVA